MWHFSLQVVDDDLGVVEVILFAVDEQIAYFLLGLYVLLLAGYDVLERLVVDIHWRVALDLTRELEEATQGTHVLARLDPDLQVAHGCHVGIVQYKQTLDDHVVVRSGGDIDPLGDQARCQIELGQTSNNRVSVGLGRRTALLDRGQVALEQIEVDRVGCVEIDGGRVVVKHVVLIGVELLVVVVHGEQQTLGASAELVTQAFRQCRLA